MPVGKVPGETKSREEAKKSGVSTGAPSLNDKVRLLYMASRIPWNDDTRRRMGSCEGPSPHELTVRR